MEINTEREKIKKLKDFTMKPPFMARQMLAYITSTLAFGDSIHGKKPEGMYKEMLERQQNRLILEIMVDSLPDYG